MSGLKATPGPWAANWHGEVDGTNIYFAHPELTVMAENEADVYLIAAAPALYEALERLFAVTVSLKFERGDGPPIINDAAYDKALAATRAALASARGDHE